jgi:hypothetical protein
MNNTGCIKKQAESQAELHLRHVPTVFGRRFWQKKQASFMLQGNIKTCIRELRSGGLNHGRMVNTKLTLPGNLRSGLEKSG